ncbi:FAD-dependent hydroxylase [Acaryochloris sp. IP29b_bin.148]|uniref:FAD-dependent hydroxylase n=1 Tax=Acaryochloris sp. IP29b_bin.148 TaxID=2969218 RepID=UPI0026101130|nr:FAD-dependent hydroxylase [Acaryochloris sp. IP29b_bin.148]
MSQVHPPSSGSSSTQISLRSPEQRPSPAPGFDYDVAIVGGGIVGATLAAALKDSGLKVVIIEAQPQSIAVAKGQAYALHLSSSRIYEGIGIWDAIAPQVEYFSQVHLSDGNCPSVVKFKPRDLKTPVLGYVAEHRVLLKELLQFLNTCDHVEWLCPAQVTATQYHQTGVEVYVSPTPGTENRASVPPNPLRVQVLVAADGARSQTRQAAGISTQGWDYWQSCLVATIAPEKFHNHIAYERFWPSGPFAILPIANNQCRIVWTAPHAQAQALLELDEDQFLERLQQRYGSQMGKLSLVGRRFIFPAKWMHSKRYVAHRLALIGDAAHTCHPVGGQGLNLGIRDAAALAQILQTADQRGQDIGELRTLQQYQRWRRRQNWLALGFTDILNRVFSNRWFLIVQGRRFGLRLLQWIAPLRVMALRFMAGLSGRSSHLAQPKSVISPQR